MKMTNALSALTLAAMLGAGLTTTANAARGDDLGALQGFSFAVMDADKNGNLTKAEVDAAFAARQKAADTNADGKLSAEEIAAMQIKEMSERATARAAKMIENLDTDGDKMLTDIELAAGKRGKVFDKIDANADGSITEVEIDDAKERMKDRHHGRGGKHGKGDRGDDQDATNN